MSASRWWNGFLLVIFIISLIISQIALLVHGAIYWSSIRNLFPHVKTEPLNKLRQLPLLSLLTWIFSLFVPLIGPLVTGSMIISQTKREKCVNGMKAFVSQVMNVCLNTSPMEEDFKLFENFNSTLHQNSVYNCSQNDWSTDKWFIDWFNSRCTEIHKYFWIWIGLRIFCFGGIILVLIITLIIAFCPKSHVSRRIRNADQYHKT
ncbi:hypothetical protein TRFO_09752 [Tritrichomonas foetus]|uniref:Uncharacterized protein n=1 Tax=Tritrichomonas foetus TaxID=1144522 RepID=A0A1J4JEX8_9EUKA|nr:hypothetical protein TRFO_09752 [Tritrichomonas foetus]|eukprot:OHS96855.1 hypothetical protein TRFO_09752 [Tritrichomonas foetus]